MNVIKLCKSIYFKLISPNKYARVMGVKMGKNCKIRTKYFGSEPYLITLGDNVGTSGNVQFITHDGSLHVLRNLYKDCRNFDLIKPINIGNNVFIGINAVILPGTKIEDNVIVGAGSIVKGKLKSDSVYAGIPAKYICSIEEYALKNKKDFINTKHLNPKEKKQYINKWLLENYAEFNL